MRSVSRSGFLSLLLVLAWTRPATLHAAEPDQPEPKSAVPTKPLAPDEVEMAFLEESADDVYDPAVGGGREVYNTQVRLVFRFSGQRWLAYDQLFGRHVTSATLHTVEEDLSATTRTWYLVASFRDTREPQVKNLKSSGFIRYSPWFAQGDLRMPSPSGWVQRLTGPVKDFPLDLGPRDQAYAGWTGAPVRRPVVLLSRPNLSDPEKWQPLAGPQLRKEVPPEVFRALTLAPGKGLTPTSLTLHQPSEGLYWDKQVFYGANDVETKVEYVSDKGDRLYGVSFKPDALVDEGDDAHAVLLCLGERLRTTIPRQVVERDRQRRFRRRRQNGIYLPVYAGERRRIRDLLE